MAGRIYHHSALHFALRSGHLFFRMRLGGKENIHLTDTERRVTSSARQISVTKCGQMVCHAGTADVPRRHGRRAAPAWQTCRAGVANNLARSTNGNKERQNDFTPCREQHARANFLLTAKKAPLCAAAAHAQAMLQSGRWAKYRWGTHDTLVTLLNFANMKSVLSRLHVWRHEIATRFTPS